MARWRCAECGPLGIPGRRPTTLVGKVPQADFAKLQRDDFAQLCVALEDEVPVL
jgi:hypothetical protein